MWELRTDQDGDDTEVEYDSFKSIIDVAEYLDGEGYIKVTDLDQYLDELEELEEGVGGTLIGGALGSGAGKAVGSTVGAGVGTAAGALIGGAVGGGDGAAAGAAIGGALGAGAGHAVGKVGGAIAGGVAGDKIGDKMQAKKAEKKAAQTKELEEGILNTAGTLAGGAVGGGLGRAVGGAIGTAVGGPVGGAIGRAVGGIGGALAGGSIGNKLTEEEELMEAIAKESELIGKLTAIPAESIRDFMMNYKRGTYFTMGTYSLIPIAAKYKANIKIYRVLEYHNITSGKTYENTAAVQEFRDATGKEAGTTWWEYEDGTDLRIAQHKARPEEKYVPYFYTKSDKDKSFCIVHFYLVHLDKDLVEKVDYDSIVAESNPYLTPSEKKKLSPSGQMAVDLKTGQVVENKARPKVTSFSHVYWLKQGGNAAREYGTQFTEAISGADDEIRVIDAFARNGRDFTEVLDSWLDMDQEIDFFTDFE
jgi:hypothetical protein